MDEAGTIRSCHKYYQCHFRRGSIIITIITPTMAIIIIMSDKSKPFTILTFGSVEPDSIC